MADFGRRNALGVLGAGVIGAGAIGASAALGLASPAAAKAKSQTAKLDFSKAEDKFRTFMLMRAALDDRLVIGCISGRYYGVVNAELKPLYGVVAATFSRHRKLADGSYEAYSTEQAYFTDLETGEALKYFDNPYTNERVEVPTGGYKPAKVIFTPDMQLKPQTMLPGAKFGHVVAPIEVRGDDVWLTETITTEAAIPNSPPFRYSETVQLHARLADLEEAGIMRVRCETYFNGTVSWRPWLKMGDRPGNLLGVGAGTYGATLDTLPADWVKAASAHRPELIKDPMSVLAPYWDK